MKVVDKKKERSYLLPRREREREKEKRKKSEKAKKKKERRSKVVRIEEKVKG